MPRRILLLAGHPAEQSFTAALADAYQGAALASGHELRRYDLPTMEFDPDFGRTNFRDPKPLEPALEAFLTDLDWAEHLVLAFPLWWGGLPARLKGLIDRTLLPGRAFDTRSLRHGLPRPMLKGRSARILMTSDTPVWALGLLYRNAVKHQITRQILGYVGIAPTRFTQFAPMNQSSAETRAAWLAAVAKLGAQGG